MDEMKKALFNAEVDLRVALATAEMLSEHFDSEYIPKTERISMDVDRYEMYGQVLASICGQLRSIAKEMDAAYN